MGMIQSERKKMSQRSTNYQEVENMYRQIRGWRHDYRNHIQTMKVLAANGYLSRNSEDGVFTTEILIPKV